MGKEFYIRILKPVPKKFREDRIFEDTELSAAGLETVYNARFNDKYHIPVKCRSIYASMDDIGAYLKTVMPGVTVKNWGMRHVHGSYHCHSYRYGWSYDIPDSVIETLKSPHIADVSVIMCNNSWSVSSYNAEYLTEKCPMYITRRSINSTITAYLEHLKGMDIEELSYEVTREEKYMPDIIKSLCAAHAYAERVGGIGYIEWE